MAFTKVDPAQAFNINNSASWQDLDLSGYVSANATGVVLKVFNPNSANANVGTRKNGSTDTRYQILRNYTTYGTEFCEFYTGLDANKICEVLSNGEATTWYLMGYCEEENAFFTNAVDKSVSSFTSWVDVDCSTDISDPCLGVIIAVDRNTSEDYGFRKNGSTDNRITERTTGYGTNTWLIGVDANKIFEHYAETTDTNIYLRGYCKTDSVFLTNASDISLSSTGSYQDISIASNALGAYIECNGTLASSAHDLRPNGSSSDLTAGFRGKHFFQITGADTSGVIEGKIASTTLDFFLVGYPVKPYTKTLTANISATGSVIKAVNKIIITTTTILSDFTAVFIPFVADYFKTITTSLKVSVNFKTMFLHSLRNFLSKKRKADIQPDAKTTFKPDAKTTFKSER